MTPNNFVIVVAGPTASGKSELAINLAQKFEGELICSDSMQIYRNLDIGTAKPTKEEFLAVPHHLFDILEPDEEFNVSLFKNVASKIIRKIESESSVPIVVGGTGQYIWSLLEDWQFSGGGSES